MDMTIKTRATLELPKELQESIKQTLAVIESLYYSEMETFQILDSECKTIAKNRNYLDCYDLKKTLFTLRVIVGFANIDMSDFDEDKYLHDLSIE
jgi:hypothetical protein